MDRFTATRGIRSCRETPGCLVLFFAERATEAGMDPTETDPFPPRPRWAIDRQLAGLVGCHVRVAVDSFSPPHWDGKCPCDLIQVKDLFLPDNLCPCSSTGSGWGYSISYRVVVQCDDASPRTGSVAAFRPWAGIKREDGCCHQIGVPFIGWVEWFGREALSRRSSALEVDQRSVTDRMGVWTGVPCPSLPQPVLRFRSIRRCGRPPSWHPDRA